jgi:membrane-associated phospholipid phosphatase
MQIDKKDIVNEPTQASGSVSSRSANSGSIRMCVPPEAPRSQKGFLPVIEAMTSVDVFAIGYICFLLVVTVLGSGRVTEWDLVLRNSAIALAFVLVINSLRARIATEAMQLVHAFYFGLLIPLLFKTTEKLSFSLHGHDYDSTLIYVDRLLFNGNDPTRWLFAHFSTSPILTEYLQFTYFLFYLLPVALAIELYRRNVKENPEHHFNDKESDDLQDLRFIIVYGFFLSYVGYLFLPAIGPRFTLHDFSNLSNELPGFYLTDVFRYILNSGENIDKTMPMTTILTNVTRDAFPSGHVDITVLTMLLAFKFKARIRWVILVLGLSLIFSTVYLRYHYVIDVIGGALFAIVTLYTWEFVESKVMRVRAWALRQKCVMDPSAR